MYCYYGGVYYCRWTESVHLDFLQNGLPEQLDDVPLATQIAMYFQCDGAPFHNTWLMLQHLNDTFPNRWIGHGSTITWPPRSPDLSPLDFCLWGWMKSEVYRRKVYTRWTARSHNGCTCLRKGTSRCTQASDTPCPHMSCKVHWCWQWNFQKFIIQVTLVLRQGYVPEKRRADRVPNSHLKQCMYWGVRRLTTWSYIVYNYTISGYMDL
jgi:hypothetical protein